MTLHRKDDALAHLLRPERPERPELRKAHVNNRRCRATIERRKDHPKWRRNGMRPILKVKRSLPKRRFEQKLPVVALIDAADIADSWRTG